MKYFCPLKYVTQMSYFSLKPKRQASKTDWQSKEKYRNSLDT